MAEDNFLSTTGNSIVGINPGYWRISGGTDLLWQEKETCKSLHADNRQTQVLIQKTSAGNRKMIKVYRIKAMISRQRAGESGRYTEKGEEKGEEVNVGEEQGRFEGIW